MKVLFVHRHPNKTDSHKRHIDSVIQIIEECLTKATGSNCFEIVTCNEYEVRDYLFDANNLGEFNTHNKLVS